MSVRTRKRLDPEQMLAALHGAGVRPTPPEAARAPENRPNVNTAPAMRAGQVLRRVRVADIKLKGHYVREFVADEEWEALKASLAANNGQPDYPITVRTEGEIGSQEIILVDGMRRLHAMRALGVTETDVINKGNISEHEAWLIQMEANDLGQRNHVLDRAVHLRVMLERGIDRDVIMRRTGISRGGFSELSRIGQMLVGLSPEDHVRARRSPRVTRTALTDLLAEHHTPDEYVAALLALVDGPEPHASGTVSTPVAVPTPTAPGTTRVRRGRGKSRQTPAWLAKRNAKGTRFSYELTWSTKHITKDPEAFLRTISAAIDEIARDALAKYQDITGITIGDAPETPAALAQRSAEVEQRAAALAASARRIVRQVGASGGSILQLTRLAAQAYREQQLGGAPGTATSGSADGQATTVPAVGPRDE